MATDIMGMPGPNSHVQWHYQPGTIRWRRMRQNETTDPKATPGWFRNRHLMSHHPHTLVPFPNGKKQWWISELKLEDYK